MFTGKTTPAIPGLWNSARVWIKEDLPSVEEVHGRVQLNKVDGMHPQVLKEMANVAKPLNHLWKAVVIKRASWQLEESKYCSHLQEGKEGRWGGNYRLVSFTLIPEKAIKQVNLETASKHVKGRKVTRSSYHRFTKWKSHLTNLAAFPSTVVLRIWWTRGKQWMFIFSEAFNTVLTSSQTNGWSTEQISGPQCGQKTNWTARLTGTKSSWRPIHRGFLLTPILFTSSFTI